jgi:hypothetical protein
MLEENPLKISEFLKNKFLFNEKSPSYIYSFRKMTIFSKENFLVLPKFFKNKNFINGKRNILVYEDFVLKPKKF